MPPLIAVACVVFLEGLAFGMIIPVLPAYCEQLGGGAMWTGVMFALLTAPKVIMNPLWGGLSDRVGRRGVLAVATIGTMSGSVLWAMAPTFGQVALAGLGWLVISRLLTGLFASQAGLAYAVASDVSTPEKRAASLGVLGAAFGLAFTLGPLIGGLFAGAFGNAAVGWLSAGGQGLSLLIIIAVLRETRPQQQSRHVTWGAAAGLDLLRGRRIVGLLVGYLCMTAALGMIFPVFQPMTEAWYGFSIGQTGIAMAVFGLIGVIVQGGLIRPTVRALGETTTTIIGLACVAAGLAGLAAHGPITVFWISTGVMAVGAGLAMPAFTGLMSLQVDQATQGRIHGLTQSATSIGRAIGFVTAGGLLAAIGVAAPFLAGVAAALLAVALLIVSLLRRPRPPV